MVQLRRLASTRLGYAAILCRAAPLIIAAPFSAIMIVGIGVEPFPPEQITTLNRCPFGSNSFFMIIRERQVRKIRRENAIERGSEFIQLLATAFQARLRDDDEKKRSE